MRGAGVVAAALEAVVLALRDLRRRRLRTALTIAGISIGILAFTVLGALAEQVNAIVEGSTRFFDGRVLVLQEAGDFRNATPLTADTADEVAALPGVGLALATVQIPLSAEVSLGAPQVITAVHPLEERLREAGSSPGVVLPASPTRYAEGRGLTAAEAGSSTPRCELGANLARKFRAEVGEEITVRTLACEVVGLREPSLTADDDAVFLPLPLTQSLLRDQLPEPFRDLLPPERLATAVIVYPTDQSVDLDLLAERIEFEVTGVQAFGPERFGAFVSQASRVLNSILFGVAAIALVVGSLSVVNTMVVAVTERTREIGIKRAVGASRRRILGELLTEAALIGLIGGVIGAALGAAVVLVLTELLEGSGTVIFRLTPRLITTTLLGATVLGVLAGAYPAAHAAHLDPVRALRSGT